MWTYDLPLKPSLDTIAATNATAGDVALNGHKITGQANGTTATDGAAFGQIPTSLPVNVGSHAARPSAASSVAGTLYWETDTTTLFESDGASIWTAVGASAGVTTFNTRSGAVTLTSGDLTTLMTQLAAGSSHLVVSGTTLAPSVDLAVTDKVDLGVELPLTVGETTMPRYGVNGIVGLLSQRLLLTYFVARKTETITQVSIATNTTAAAATPTLCRIGIYSIDSSTFAGTLVASIANDTTLFAAASTNYVRSLSSSWSKVAGTTYAFGLLVVSGAAMPTFYGNAFLPNNNLSITGGGARTKPSIAASLTGQTDLPGSFTDASLVGGGALPLLAVVLP